jgi:hypothetical protein
LNTKFDRRDVCFGVRVFFKYNLLIFLQFFWVLEVVGCLSQEDEFWRDGWSTATNETWCGS